MSKNLVELMAKQKVYIIHGYGAYPFGSPCFYLTKKEALRRIKFLCYPHRYKVVEYVIARTEGGK
jgi:hypothetical protein